MSGLTFGSLFAGIGGMDLGLERAGWECRWQVEIDDYATRVLEKHWPYVERFRDIRDCGAANLAPVDLIAGGFPCQDISNAGKRAGITGERSGLWTEFARVVRELRPRYILVENVADLLSRGIGTVLGDLAACGYDAEWQCIPAAAVGAPHIRDRVFILAYTNDSQRRAGAKGGYVANGHDSGRQETASGPTAQRPDGRARDVAHTDSAGPIHVREGEAGRECLPRGDAPSHSSWWNIEPDVGRVANGVPARVDRLRGLGNAVVPQVAEWVGRQILAHAELMAARLEEAG